MVQFRDIAGIKTVEKVMDDFLQSTHLLLLVTSFKVLGTGSNEFLPFDNFWQPIQDDVKKKSKGNNKMDDEELCSVLEDSWKKYFDFYRNLLNPEKFDPMIGNVMQSVTDFVNNYSGQLNSMISQLENSRQDPEFDRVKEETMASLVNACSRIMESRMVLSKQEIANSRKAVLKTASEFEESLLEHIKLRSSASGVLEWMNKKVSRRGIKKLETCLNSFIQHVRSHLSAVFPTFYLIYLGYLVINFYVYVTTRREALVFDEFYYQFDERLTILEDERNHTLDSFRFGMEDGALELAVVFVKAFNAKIERIYSEWMYEKNQEALLAELGLTENKESKTGSNMKKKKNKKEKDKKKSKQAIPEVRTEIDTKVVAAKKEVPVEGEPSPKAKVPDETSVGTPKTPTFDEPAGFDNETSRQPATTTVPLRDSNTFRGKSKLPVLQQLVNTPPENKNKKIPATNNPTPSPDPSPVKTDHEAIFKLTTPPPGLLPTIMTNLSFSPDKPTIQSPSDRTEELEQRYLALKSDYQQLLVFTNSLQANLASLTASNAELIQAYQLKDRTLAEYQSRIQALESRIRELDGTNGTLKSNFPLPIGFERPGQNGFVNAKSNDDGSHVLAPTLTGGSHRTQSTLHFSMTSSRKTWMGRASAPVKCGNCGLGGHVSDSCSTGCRYCQGTHLSEICANMLLK